MSMQPQAVDENTKVMENIDILDYPPEEDEDPDDETGEDPDEEPEDDDSPVTIGEPE